ncbi:hypothetical protein Slu03_04560 [Sediminihabitans luteus]|nr:hypothetical protein Slu03_04560 [Sediminihabitans luteus]
MSARTDLDDLVRLRRARDTMDRDYAEPLDVPALARVALMSPGHFFRSFLAAYGETPYAYLMTRRIERAKALLRRGRPLGHGRVHGGRLHLARVVQLPLHRARGRESERVPRARPRARRPGAGVRGQGRDPTGQESRSTAPTARVASWA